MVETFGILNITPDSFSDGGKYSTPEDALAHADTLFASGAMYVDVGAESTNPKSTALTPQEEQARLKPVLPLLLEQYPGKISLDTYHHQTARWALQFGRPIINDVSGVSEAMAELAAAYGLTVIAGHLPTAAEGIPIRSHTVEHVDDLAVVVGDTENNIQRLGQLGIGVSELIIDPGIGFGKTMRLNWELLTFAKHFPQLRVMIGASHKRFLGCDPHTGEVYEDSETLRYSDDKNIETATTAVESGARYLRVHKPENYKNLLK
jgi:dihydropteroate synthase